MSDAEVKMSQRAINECVAELRAACRRPIDEHALKTLLGWLRPNFERILDCPEGRSLWVDYGPHMRTNGRFLGALSDYYAYFSDLPIVSSAELTRAYEMVRSACRVGLDAAHSVSDSPPEAYPRSISSTHIR